MFVAASLSLSLHSHLCNKYEAVKVSPGERLVGREGTRVRRQMKTRFLSPHHFSVQRGQTILITVCSVEVSPPPPDRFTTPSTFTEHGPKILGQKPKTTTKVTLKSHQ